MKIFVDADACPVVPQTLRIAEALGVPVVLVCDTSHQFSNVEAQVIVCEKGADSADLVLINRLSPGDLVVTQDYGVAALALSRGCRALNQDGMEYSDANMDSLLFSRHLGKKIRAAGGRTKGPKRRTSQQNAGFEQALRILLEACLDAEDIGRRC